MCGISGYIKLGSNHIKDTSCILSMLKLQKHRGPDDSGIMVYNLNSGESAKVRTEERQTFDRFYDGVIGFNRLSILDLSSNGHQPMVSSDNKVILALNGEIYNAFGYTNELQKWGYKFKSKTDTEIVLALYLKYGFTGMLNMLNGMFALVVIDLRSHELFITRDRFGIKPMYYLQTHDIFAFSSEIKSFKKIENFAFRLAEDKLDEYLLFRNNYKGTLFRDIQSLEPGHYLSFSNTSGLQLKQYFNINNYSRTQKDEGDLNYYGANLEKWMSNSVQSQLMSDVKLGCQLSGGIDSTIVTWLANRNSSKGNFESVSIIFGDQRFNEENYINRVSDKLGITSHKFLLDSDYYFDNLEKAVWHLEFPLNHPNTIAIFKLSQRAKEYVTVLLSGEGADEVFGGYTRFYDISYPYYYKVIFPEIFKNLCNPKNLIKYGSDEYRAIMATAFISPGLAKKIKHGFDLEYALKDRKSFYSTLTGSYFDRQVKYEINTYLPDLLIRQDKMSMAHSIENRVPFLDNEVVENSFKIPEKYLVLRKSPEGTNTEKYLLKKITSDTFGSDFAFRDKMGFTIPLREFFMNERFSEYLNDKIIEGIRQRELFDPKLITGWLANLNNLRYQEIEALWVIISLEIWASVYIDNNDNWDTKY